jgi:gamma-glutamyl-gamma-aminobutyrate hydrolase
MGVTSHGVNTFHHQAIKQPGANVEIVAQAEDGIPEGMVVAGHPYAVAVQFHPEDLAYTDAASQRLFDAFVHACAEYAERAASGSAIPASASA